MRKHLSVALASLLLAGTALAAEPAGTAHPNLWPTARSQGLVDPATEAFINGLLAKLTLEEKVGQLIQADLDHIKPEDLAEYPLGSILAGGDASPIGGNNRSGPGPWIATAQAYRAAALAPRPGRTPIPIIFGIDSVRGNNNVVGATLFPHNIGLGAANDPDLMRRIGQVTAQETAAIGADWAFAPTLAAPRNDRWGRTYEGYSEDPAVIVRLAGPMVEGLQGKAGGDMTVQGGHVAASAKHFLGDGGTHDGIDQGDTQVDEQTLIKLHAQGYPKAIEAGSMTVMASFNSWNGVKMHGNKSLLTDVLKGRMGFDGFVIGDWNGHGQIPGCSNDSCPDAINAGLDMFMAPDKWKALYHNTLAQAKAGTIPMARIDDAVRRILRVKAKLGLFKPERPWEGKQGVLGSPEHRAVARDAVAKSLVLLKNNSSVLPVKPGAKVLVAGDAADDIGRQSGGWTLSWQGTGNSNKDFPGATSIHAGLKQAVEAAGGTVELAADGQFRTKPDIAIVVIGETPYAEGQGDLATLEYQPGNKVDLALLKRLKAAGVPTVVVFLSGRPLWVNPELNAADAFVAAWLPGSEGGGIADVLVAGKNGKPARDFTGKLSFSWPKTAAQAVLNQGDPGYDPLFPLGYGLTYATPKPVPALSEESGVDAASANRDNFFVRGRTPAPWAFALSADGKTATPGGDGEASLPTLSMRVVDAGGVQGAGRLLSWTGPGAVAITGPALDLSTAGLNNRALLLEFQGSGAPQGPLLLQPVADKGGIDLTPLLSGGTGVQKVKLSQDCLKKAGADLKKLPNPLRLSSQTPYKLTLITARLVADPTDATCPVK
jgi:beta-glucosidase